MIKSIEVNKVVTELNLYKRLGERSGPPKPTDSLYIPILGRNRFYSNVPRVKALFKLLKQQKHETVLVDYSKTDQVTIAFNDGCSEYVLFNEKGDSK